MEGIFAIFAILFSLATLIVFFFWFLQMLKITRQNRIINSMLLKVLLEKMKHEKMDIDSFYNSYAEHDTLPRYRLPCVPSVIKVPENAKLREQT